MPRTVRLLAPAILAVGVVLLVSALRARKRGDVVQVAPAAEASPTLERGGEPAVIPAAIAPASSGASETAVIAVHEITVAEPLFTTAQRAGDPMALPSFTVPLGGGRSVDVDVAHFEDLGVDERVYSGSVRGQRESQAVFSYVGLAYAGTVVLGDEQRAYYITATEDGRMRITELDLTRAPGCGAALPPEMAMTGNGR